MIESKAVLHALLDQHKMTEDFSTVDVILLLKLLSTVNFKKVIKHLLSVEVE